MNIDCIIDIGFGPSRSCIPVDRTRIRVAYQVPASIRGAVTGCGSAIGLVAGIQGSGISCSKSSCIAICSITLHGCKYIVG